MLILKEQRRLTEKVLEDVDLRGAGGVSLVRIIRSIKKEKGSGSDFRKGGAFTPKKKCFTGNDGRPSNVFRTSWMKKSLVEGNMRDEQRSPEAAGSF